MKTYVVSTDFSKREIQARNKKEAVSIFKAQLKGLITKNDKIKLNILLKYCDDEIAVEKEIQREWKALCCVEITIEHLTGKQAIELVK